MSPLSLSYNVILGSQSPRRKALLAGLDIPFEVEVIPTDEGFSDNMIFSEVAPFLAELKANCFAEKINQDSSLLIITADTIVATENEILNKPINEEHAKEMIRKLSNAMHTVYTGVCIYTQEKKEVFVNATKVHFDQLSEEEITYYIEKYKPYDKAGSYGVQEWIGYIGIKKIEGCYFNVMGLPVNELYRRLKGF